MTVLLPHLSPVLGIALRSRPQDGQVDVHHQAFILRRRHGRVPCHLDESVNRCKHLLGHAHGPQHRPGQLSAGFLVVGTMGVVDCVMEKQGPGKRRGPIAGAPAAPTAPRAPSAEQIHGLLQVLGRVIGPVGLAPALQQLLDRARRAGCTRCAHAAGPVAAQRFVITYSRHMRHRCQKGVALLHCPPNRSENH